MKTLPLPDELKRVLVETPELGRAYLVGGCVRDHLLGRPVHDIDLEVFGVNYETLVDALARWGRTDLVGRSFGVVKLTLRAGGAYDFTVPRRDSKVALGHKGFEIDLDPDISLEEAASRRDYTINALMYDPRAGEVLDFFGGLADLDRRVLRHTSEAFPEDPLRVLRGMQFVSRFELNPAPETVALCRSIKMSHAELARERVREEWFKWASLSVAPSRGLRMLEDTEWMEHYPEILALRDTRQDPEWHPEGNVLAHTRHCCDALVSLQEWRSADVESRIVYMLAVLAHDFGKPSTTHEAERNGLLRIVSPGHEELGGEVAEAFLERIDAPQAVRRRVVPLVRQHLAHLQAPLTDRAVRRLARRLEPENIEGLCVVMTADHFGRPPLPQELPDSLRQLRERARELSVQDHAPGPILMGRHLLDRGMKPGPAFGKLLEAAYEAQLEGEFGDLDGALRWLEGGGAQSAVRSPRSGG